jgi:hypothetical protein
VTREAATIMAGVVVSVAAKNCKDSFPPIEVSSVDVSIIENATAGAG